MKKCLILLTIPLLLARPVYAMDGGMDGGGLWGKIRTMIMCCGCCCETYDSCLKYGFNVKQAIRTYRAELEEREVEANAKRFNYAYTALANQEEQCFFNEIGAERNLKDMEIIKNYRKKE